MLAASSAEITQQDRQHGGAGVAQRLLDLLGSAGGLLSGVQQGAVGRLLQLLLHAGGKRGAVLKQPVPLGRALRVVALDLKTQAGRVAEVLAHQREPGASGRGLEVGDMGIEDCQKIPFAPREDGVDCRRCRVPR